MYVYTRVYTHINVHIYISIYVLIYVRVCVYTCIYIYISMCPSRRSGGEGERRVASCTSAKDMGWLWFVGSIKS